MQRRAALSAAAGFALSAAFGPAIGAPLKLRFAHAHPESDGQHKAALKFAELVKARSGGQIEIAVFANSSLGTDQAMISGVRGGIIDLELSGTPYFTGISGRMNVLDLPFMFRDADHAHKALDGPIGRSLLDDLGSHGMKGLAFWEVGFRNLTNSRRAVKRPEDVKGLKLRTTPNPAHLKAFQLLGANPLPMPFSEVYMALETRAVDGQENPLPLIAAAKLYEVQKYLSLTRHAYTAMPLVMNKAKFDALPAAQQKVLLDAALEAGRFQRELNRQGEAANLAELKQRGMAVEENVDVDAFARIVAAPVRKDYTDKFGSELVDAIAAVK
jgi:tripartite ATP-independent transporter DctP family solute receptor